MIQADSTSPASYACNRPLHLGLAALIAFAHRRAEYGFDPVCDARQNVGVERVKAVTQSHHDALGGILACLALVLHSLVVLGSGRLAGGEVDATWRGDDGNTVWTTPRTLLRDGSCIYETAARSQGCDCPCSLCLTFMRRSSLKVDDLP